MFQQWSKIVLTLKHRAEFTYLESQEQEDLDLIYYPSLKDKTKQYYYRIIMLTITCLNVKCIVQHATSGDSTKSLAK